MCAGATLEVFEIPLDGFAVVELIEAGLKFFTQFRELELAELLLRLETSECANENFGLTGELARSDGFLDKFLKLPWKADGDAHPFRLAENTAP